MHELSVAAAVLNTALKNAGERRVTAVAVRAGRLRQVVPESLRFYFEIVARDTACEGARLELTEVPVRLRCAACGNQWAPDSPLFRCPKCASADIRVLAGEELSVEYIEVEETEPACTGPR
jgi:hydrogenase nickel incorporation protein HypA/HybF